MMNPMTKNPLLRNLLVARYFKPNKEEKGISLLLALMMGLVLITGATGLLMRQQMTRKIGSSESYQQMAETAASNGFNRIISELNNDRQASYRGYLYAIENRCLDPVDAPAECEPASDHYYWSLLGSKAVPVGLGELCANTSAGLPVHPEGSKMVWPTNTVPFSKDKTETLRDDGKEPIQTFYRLRSYRPELGKSGNGQGRFSVEGLVKRVGAKDNEYLARTLLTRTLSIETKVPEVAVMASRHFNLGPARINGPGVIIVDVDTTDGFPTGCNATNLLNIVKGNNSNDPDLGSLIWPVLERGMLSPVFYERDDTKDKEPDSDLDRIWNFDDSAKGASGCEESVVCTSSHSNGKPKKPEGVEITGSWGENATVVNGGQLESRTEGSGTHNQNWSIGFRIPKINPALSRPIEVNVSSRERELTLQGYENAKRAKLNWYNNLGNPEKIGYQRYCKESFDPKTPLSGERISSGSLSSWNIIKEKKRLYGGLAYTSPYFIICNQILKGSVPNGVDLIDTFYAYKAPATSSLSEARKKERESNIKKFQSMSTSAKNQQRRECSTNLRNRQNAAGNLDDDGMIKTCGDYELAGMKQWTYSPHIYQPPGNWYYSDLTISSSFDDTRPPNSELTNEREKEIDDRAKQFREWSITKQNEQKEWCQKLLERARDINNWDTDDVIKCGDWGMWEWGRTKRACGQWWARPDFLDKTYKVPGGMWLHGMSPTHYLRIRCEGITHKDLYGQAEGKNNQQEDWVVKISKDDICKGRGNVCHLYVENINLKNTKVLIENQDRPIVIHLVKSKTVQQTPTLSPAQMESGRIRFEGMTSIQKTNWENYCKRMQASIKTHNKHLAPNDRMFTQCIETGHWVTNSLAGGIAGQQNLVKKTPTLSSSQMESGRKRFEGMTYYMKKDWEKFCKHVQASITTINKHLPADHSMFIQCIETGHWAANNVDASSGANNANIQNKVNGIFKITDTSSLCGVDKGKEICNEKPERLVITSTDGDGSLACDNPSNLELTFVGASLPSSWISLPKGRVKITGDANMRGVIWANSFCSQGNSLQLNTNQKDNADESVVKAADLLWDLNRHASFKAYGRSITRGVRGNLFDIFKRW